MRTIAENIMEKEFEILGVVYSVEEMKEMNLGVVFDKEDIDEKHGTLVWDCGWCIGGEKAVDIVRTALIYEGYEEVEDMTNDELSDFVDENYNKLYWCFE